MEKQKSIGNWLEDLNEENLKKSEEVGEIFPKLIVPPIEKGEEVGKVVKVRFIESEPKKVISEKFKYGKEGFVIVVERLSDKVKYSLWLPKSLRFKLGVFFKKYGTLKDLKVGIWKSLTELEEWGTSTVYNAQLLERP